MMRRKCSIFSANILSTDSVTIREGISGDEPKEVYNELLQWASPSDSRVILAINTFHPSVCGSTFLNRHILKILNTAFGDSGIYIVTQEVSVALESQGGVIPIEQLEWLSIDNMYMLIDDNCQKVGYVMLWDMMGHSKCDVLYQDTNTILDVLLPQSLLRSFINRSLESLRRGDVPTEHMRIVSVSNPSALGNMIRFLKG